MNSLPLSISTKICLPITSTVRKCQIKVKIIFHALNKIAPNKKFNLDLVEQMSKYIFFFLIAGKQCCHIVRTLNRKLEKKPFYCVFLSSLLTIFLFSSSKENEVNVYPALLALMHIFSNPRETRQ